MLSEELSSELFAAAAGQTVDVGLTQTLNSLTRSRRGWFFSRNSFRTEVLGCDIYCACLPNNFVLSCVDASCYCALERLSLSSLFRYYPLLSRESIALSNASLSCALRHHPLFRPSHPWLTTTSLFLTCLRRRACSHAAPRFAILTRWHINRFIPPWERRTILLFQ